MITYMSDIIVISNSSICKEDFLLRIEKLAKKKIQKIALSAIHSCFEKKSDPFFAGKLLSRYSFDYYKKHIKTWRDELSEIDISVTAYPKFRLVNGNYTRKWCTS